jgi:hypothetical protein
VLRLATKRDSAETVQVPRFAPTLLVTGDMATGGLQTVAMRPVNHGGTGAPTNRVMARRDASLFDHLAHAGPRLFLQLPKQHFWCRSGLDLVELRFSGGLSAEETAQEVPQNLDH